MSKLQYYRNVQYLNIDQIKTAKDKKYTSVGPKITELWKGGHIGLGLTVYTNLNYQEVMNYEII